MQAIVAIDLIKIDGVGRRGGLVGLLIGSSLVAGGGVLWVFSCVRPYRNS